MDNSPVYDIARRVCSALEERPTTWSSTGVFLPFTCFPFPLSYTTVVSGDIRRFVGYR